MPPKVCCTSRNRERERRASVTFKARRSRFRFLEASRMNAKARLFFFEEARFCVWICDNYELPLLRVGLKGTAPSSLRSVTEPVAAEEETEGLDTSTLKASSLSGVVSP